MLKIILIGDQAVGKTALLNRYAHNLFNEYYKGTIGADFVHKEVILGDRTVYAQIWDTAGQERFRSLGNVFYRGAKACVLVFDVNDEASFRSLDRWRADFLSQSGVGEDEAFPFILVGTKIDLEGRAQGVSAARAKEWARDHGDIPYFETSSKTGEGVEEAFLAVVEEARNVPDVFDFGAGILASMTHKEILDTKRNVRLAGDDDDDDDPARGDEGCGC